ncbi:hypothetical protein BLOT_001465 [Blomia tropicalis]|nr:hypothetical protein BLOT_001465 [Blomia tropicalis]
MALNRLLELVNFATKSPLAKFGVYNNYDIKTCFHFTRFKFLSFTKPKKKEKFSFRDPRKIHIFWDNDSLVYSRESRNEASIFLFLLQHRMHLIVSDLVQC